MILFVRSVTFAALRQRMIAKPALYAPTKRFRKPRRRDIRTSRGSLPPTTRVSAPLGPETMTRAV